MKVASFYRFVDVPDPEALAASAGALCRELGVLGTILVAAEGVNGMLAADAGAVRRVLERLARSLGLERPLAARWTEANEAPFRRMRVRVKPEIVALGRPDVRPQRRTGRHVAAAQWNALIDRADTLLIDVRNRYETAAGTFPGAADPGTDSFREFADYAAGLPEAERARPVAMFCTGGVRCEKAAALMLELGFESVYQLEGGILNYLDQVKGADNRWEGDCFVFDDRILLDRDLSPG